MSCACSGKRESTFDYDRTSNLERRSVKCLECGDVEDTVEPGGEYCYPQNVEDMLDLGLDPYIIEAFGGVGQLRAPMRRAAPAGRDTSRAAAARPSEEDERWRRERSEMLARLKDGIFG